MALEEKHIYEDLNQYSILRSQELKNKIDPYLKSIESIPTGYKSEDLYQSNRKIILDYFKADITDWDNWHWQLKHRINDVETLDKIIGLSPIQKEEISIVGHIYRWAISPYYLSLVDFSNPFDPIMLQSIPSIMELQDDNGEEDPMAEALTSPAPCITRRYPDRLIINVTNLCGMYCRHCQRRRNIGEIDSHRSKDDLASALEYIRNSTEIRDVLITGGDALLLNDETLEWLLKELHNMPHVEIIRLGTRVPVTLPARVTENLVKILAKYPPLYLNTQFNHPKEVTMEAKGAIDKLISAGVIVGNQAVLLKGINNDPHIMKKLNQELLKTRVRPYYIFHAKNVKGTKHFVPSIQEGLSVMENLRGYTSGLAVPSILSTPPRWRQDSILPQYLLSLKGNKAIFRSGKAK
jgi:lysine 2,3-aminomutase